MERRQTASASPFHRGKRASSRPQHEGKLIKRGYEPTAENAVYAVHDAAGVRVICPLVDDVASVAQFIRELSNLRSCGKKETHILHPKPNGYRPATT